MFLCQCYGTIRTKTTLPKMSWGQHFWFFFLQLLIHLAPQRNLMRGEARHKNLMGNFCPCMHKVLFIPSLQLAKTPMSTCFPFPLHWCVCKLEGTSHSCLVLSHPVSALAAAVRTTEIINWKMKLALNVLFCSFFLLPFKSLCWSEVFAPEAAGCHPGKCQREHTGGKRKGCFGAGIKLQ